jgi:hypothetical protein
VHGTTPLPPPPYTHPSTLTHLHTQWSGKLFRGFRQRQLLAQYRTSIVGCTLHGYIFFGSALAILRDVKRLIFVEVSMMNVCACVCVCVCVCVGVGVCVCVLSDRVHAAICEGPYLPALKRSSHKSLGLYLASVNVSQYCWWRHAAIQGFLLGIACMAFLLHFCAMLKNMIFRSEDHLLCAVFGLCVECVLV